MPLDLALRVMEARTETACMIYTKTCGLQKWGNQRSQQRLIIMLPTSQAFEKTCIALISKRQYGSRLSSRIQQL